VTEPDLAQHFTSLGIDLTAVEVYRNVLASGSVSLTDLVAAGLPADAAARQVGTLVDAGLIAAHGSKPDSFVAVPPESGLRVLTSRRQGEINRAMVAVQSAYRKYGRQSRPADVDQLVEVVTGSAIVSRLRQADTLAAKQVRTLDSPPYDQDRPSTETKLAHLAGGIAYRVVYSQASLALENFLDENVVPCIRAGEQARILPKVPVKLRLVDDQLALVSLSITETDVNHTLLVVRPSTLFSALVGLFEMCWQSALPILADGKVASKIEPVEARMLGLLSAGLTDEEIVRTLRVSRRTFFRYLERLQARTGVTSRFQLGVYAVRQGWLPEQQH
jgi:DNA-binding CsgD family transcriptional regulator